MNKKVNRIQKKTKPETLIYEDMDLTQYHNGLTCNADNTQFGYTCQKALFTELVHDNTAEKFPMLGSMTRINDVKLYFNFRRSGYADCPDIYGRITILKMSKVASVRDMDWIHYTPSRYNSVYDSDGFLIRTNENINDIVFGPLTNDISSIGKVVKDVKFKMRGGGDPVLNLNKKIKLFGQTLRKSSAYGYPDILQNDYYICYTIGFSSFSYDQATTFTSIDTICTQFGLKAGFIENAELDVNSRVFGKRYAIEENKTN